MQVLIIKLQFCRFKDLLLGHQCRKLFQNSFLTIHRRDIVQVERMMGAGKSSHLVSDRDTYLHSLA